MILIDSDVLLDVVLQQEPEFERSRALLDEVRRVDEAASIAWHTVSNVHYIARQRGVDALDFLVGLMDWVGIAPTTADGVRYAASLPMSDFEDALQVAAAEACGARLIITRNLRDYRQSPIQALTPRDMLNEWR